MPLSFFSEKKRIFAHDMELRQLKYFAKVAELRSFSEAARVLYVSQSTLSQQVRQLEHELDATLLVRDSHRVELSDAGRAFLPSALRTLAEADNSLDSIRNVKQLQTGVLRIGSTFTFSLLLGLVLRDFIGRYPSVKVEVVSDRMDELMTMLDHGQIDVALSYRSLREYPNIQSTTLFDNHLAVVMSPTHPLADRAAVGLKDLEKCRLALPMKGMQARNTLDSLLAGSGLQLHVQLEMNTLPTLLDLVASTHLVTLVSQATARMHKGLVALPIEGIGATMEGCYHVRRDSYLKCAAREFVRLLEANKTLGIMEMM